MGVMVDQLGWREAIIEVLRGKSEAMHYTDIAEEIRNRQLRTEFGATPASTVNAYVSTSLSNERDSSPFDRTSRGHYRLRDINSDAHYSPNTNSVERGIEPAASTIEEEEVEEPAGLINALGMYWSRHNVIWDAKSSPRLFGKQSASDEFVDLSDQRGVYLLHDRSSVIYVGRAIDQGIAVRLKQHTVDRLNGRWDRFSWFGIYAVSPDGKLVPESKPFSTSMLIATMEALLIESVEPPQNRRRGDDFKAVEFLQAMDPDIEKRKVLQMVEEFKAHLLVR